MKPFAYLLLIILLCTSIASAYDEDDLEWVRVKLEPEHWGLSGT